jgi:hypothetical protein
VPPTHHYHPAWPHQKIALQASDAGIVAGLILRTKSSKRDRIFPRNDSIPPAKDAKM